MAIKLTRLGESGQQLESYLFEGPVVEIGRAEGNSLTLRDPSVSRKHAVLEQEGGRWRLVNLSDGGTGVDGALIRDKIFLRSGMLLQLGNHVVSVDLDAQAAVPVRPVRSRSPEIPRPLEVTSRVAVSQGEHRSNQPQAGLHGAQGSPAHGSPARSGAAPPPIIPPDIKLRLHSHLLDYLSIKTLDLNAVRDPAMRARARKALVEILERNPPQLPARVNREELIKEVLDDALGLGPLQDLIEDDTVSEIMVVSKDTIFVEKAGKIQLATRTFTSEDAVRSVIERIVTPIGRRIDESTPLVDARLRDGSRVNAIIPPLALKGPTITIRKFSKKPLLMPDLVRFGTLDDRMARFLERCVVARKNIVISGGTGSGKTTLLNVLSSFISEEERVVTIEDAAELRLQQAHVVSLETRPPNVEGKGEYSIRHLVKNALRMRPDRIIVGECRGAEALDMLQAMNTGHDGSMTTGHANSPEDMLSRLETMVLQGGVDLPLKAIRQQIVSACHVIVQQLRLSDGSRRITHISEVVELSELGHIRIEDIFRFKQTGVSATHKVEGYFMATGYMPGFLEEFLTKGLISGGDYL